MTKRDMFSDRRFGADRGHTLGRESMHMCDVARQAIEDTKRLLESVAHQLNGLEDSVE